jgi:hypothetical protein
MGVPYQRPISGSRRWLSQIGIVDGCPYQYLSVADSGAVFGAGVGGAKEHVVLPVVENTHR